VRMTDSPSTDKTIQAAKSLVRKPLDDREADAYVALVRPQSPEDSPMGMNHALPLLAYALPVLRLLETALVEVPLGAVQPGQERGPPRCTPPRPEGLPEGLAALLEQACHELPDRNTAGGSLFIHVTDGSFRIDVPGKESILEAIPQSPENREPPPDG